MTTHDDEGRPLRQERAEILHDGIPYVRGWAEAQRATLALAEELRALGFEEDFAYMKADVNCSGEGVVRLDVVTTDAAQRLVRLLTLGLCSELERLPTTEVAEDAIRHLLARGES